jgi:cellulose synthase/poly-beta-1,6-N-acetylglucosamine synthase-like glycosyltransferase
LQTTASPLVSVVIPCFNQAHFLPEAIESVLGQTHAPMEVIVVDDGSEDNTDPVAGRYDAVRRLYQPNEGAPSARNRGLGECKGEFVLFLDSDDRLLPEAVESGLRALREQPDSGAAVGACRNIDAGGLPLDVPGQPLIHSEHYLALLKSCFILSGSSVLFRKSALQQVGGFDQGLALGDDYDLYLRIARLHPLACHGQVVTEYRRHSQSLTGDPTATMRGELGALRRQRRQVRGKRESAARRQGIRRARRIHGGEMSETLRRQLQEREWVDAARTGLALLRAYPRGLLGLAPGTRRPGSLSSVAVL